MMRARYSLAALICVVTIAAAGLAAIVNKGHRQREAIQVIKKYDGQYVYDYQFSDKVQAYPQWMRRLFGDDGFQDIASVSIANFALTDEDVHKLRHLKRVKSLYLHSPPANG